LAEGEKLKAEGNGLFQEKKYDLAAEKYFEGLYHVDFDQLQYNFELMDVHREQLDKIRVPLLLNLSFCHLNEKDAQKSVHFATLVFDFDKTNMKALYRRAKAYVALNDYDKAKEDLALCAKNHKLNAEVRRLYEHVNEEVKRQKKESDELLRAKLSKHYAKDKTEEEKSQEGGKMGKVWNALSYLNPLAYMKSSGEQNKTADSSESK